MAQVRLTEHALLKLRVLMGHRVTITVEAVIETVLHPEIVQVGYAGRRIAQSTLDADHVLRVVFEETGDTITVITMYPARKGRYDQNPV